GRSGREWGRSRRSEVPRHRPAIDPWLHPARHSRPGGSGWSPAVTQLAGRNRRDVTTPAASPGLRLPVTTAARRIASVTTPVPQRKANRTLWAKTPSIRGVLAHNDGRGQASSGRELRTAGRGLVRDLGVEQVVEGEAGRATGDGPAEVDG